jgi:hypothetical protein
VAAFMFRDSTAELGERLVVDAEVPRLVPLKPPGTCEFKGERLFAEAFGRGSA